MHREFLGKFNELVRISDLSSFTYGDSLRDSIVKDIYRAAEEVTKKVVTQKSQRKISFDKKIDDLLTSRIFGYPIMILLLGLVFWITITGANYPSQMLANLFFWLEGKLTYLFMILGSPQWLHGILILGIYRTLAWVISVMLPPMAIFFPIFTLLEDLGYLPRVAFNLDRLFKKAGAHGKQSLTMSMGFGCNAAGIIACRIIESPREKLIAILTNNFVPCNGRFPTLIALATIFLGGLVASQYSSLAATLFVTLLVVFGIIVTLIVSWVLSKTILKGIPSSFTLELPPYRKPKVGRVIYTSLIDRTIFVLGRAIAVAAPAGLIIWILANITLGDKSILSHSAAFLDPFARMIGLDGFILMAFIIGLPANEIVVPIIIMSYMSKGAMLELESLLEMQRLFIDNGWTFLTALNVMLFSLFHFPCGTALWTIGKETGSLKWTMLSALIPTVIGIAICFIVTQGARLLGLVF